MAHPIIDALKNSFTAKAIRQFPLNIIPAWRQTLPTNRQSSESGYVSVYHNSPRGATINGDVVSAVIMLAIDECMKKDSGVVKCSDSVYCAEYHHQSGKITYVKYDTLNIGVMHDMAPLCAQIVIVDEASMCDSYIAKCLFSRIGEKTALVMVGDSDQLPSVGAGDVLSQLISSEHVPVHRLKVIFRQKAGDPIIINAAKIREGDTTLVQAMSFRMCGIEDPKDIFRRTCDFYVRCVKQFSIDEVTLLIPHKRKGYLCADTLNEELEKRLNPNASGETITVMKKTFHIGDRVMQTKNTDDAKNGDVGTIVNIVDRPKKSDPYSYERYCDIDFEGGLSVSYTLSDMKNIDLAYATSVHKSQGQEFKTVIVVMAEEHNLMAKRNLLYTAVTRAKENVALIGHERTFLRAITQEKGEEDRRCTQLAYFIDILKRQKDAADASTKAG